MNMKTLLKQFSILFQKDEFFAPLPADVIDRLVVRPEDTQPLVETSIKSFKEALLHVFEVKNRY